MLALFGFLGYQILKDKEEPVAKAVTVPGTGSAQAQIQARSAKTGTRGGRSRTGTRGGRSRTGTGA